MATARKLRRRESEEGAFGYLSLLGLRSSDLRELLRSVERGLPFKALEHFTQAAPLTLPQILDLVQISPRTLARRKHEGRLLRDESDRLLRIARLMAKVIDLFDGNRHAAASWLQAPQIALGGAVALDMARTELGAREVETLVDRLEHGVFS
jgi:putative toxin-antitoxin system antitoxin component (TIGR02293 family)